MIDHDRLFKQLLAAFWNLSSYLCRRYQYLDPASISFLDKEVFTDITSGEKHEADLVVKTRFKQQDAFFLIHIETQSSAKSMICLFTR